jgi:hypothetical protein
MARQTGGQAMEIDVTHMVEDSDEMFNLSGSRMEHGQDAGAFTWNNSKAYGANHPLLTSDEMRNAARSHFREYGAWSEDDIAAWSEDELQGITCQDVAAAIREMESADDYEDYVKGCEQGTYSSRLYKGDNGHWYFYLGM